MKRGEIFEALAQYRKDEAVVYTMSAFNEWSLRSNGPLDFFLGGGMSFASSIGLGIALAQPQRGVWILDGDGSLLMNLGTLVTIAEQEPPNLFYFVLNNGVYEIPGCVPVPGTGKVSLPALAKAAGLPAAYEYGELGQLKKDLGRLLKESGPVFVSLRVAPVPAPFEKGRMRGSAEMARNMEQFLTGTKG